jgi:hypothetical protein
MAIRNDPAFPLPGDAAGGKMRQRSVRVGVGLAFEIEAYRQKLGPIPPASAALFRHLLALDLAKAREETDTGVVDFPSSGSQEA